MAALDRLTIRFAVALWLGTVAPAAAQAPNDALLRLLQVLRDRGSISAQEYDEIRLVAAGPSPAAAPVKLASLRPVRRHRQLRPPTCRRSSTRRWRTSGTRGSACAATRSSALPTSCRRTARRSKCRPTARSTPTNRSSSDAAASSSAATPPSTCRSTRRWTSTAPPAPPISRCRCATSTLTCGWTGPSCGACASASRRCPMAG